MRARRQGAAGQGTVCWEGVQRPPGASSHYPPCLVLFSLARCRPRSRRAPMGEGPSLSSATAASCSVGALAAAAQTATTTRIRCCREGVATGQQTPLPQTSRATHGPQAGNGSWPVPEPPVTWRPRRPGQEQQVDMSNSSGVTRGTSKARAAGRIDTRSSFLPSAVSKQGRSQTTAPKKEEKRGVIRQPQVQRWTRKERMYTTGPKLVGRGAPRTLDPSSSSVPQPSACHPQTQAPHHRTKRPATRHRRYGDCVSPFAASTAAIQRLAAALASKRRVPPKSAVSDSRGMWSYSTE